MIEIVEGGLDHIPQIKEIADKTWAITYADIISKDQINYMIEMMYSKSSLIDQMTVQKQYFLLIKRSESISFEGFVSFEFDYENANTTKLHKLYILPQSQNYGLGGILIDNVCSRAKVHGNNLVQLNMNRNNEALYFYKRKGFEIIKEENIDIGNGYFMEDFILAKPV